VIRPRLFREDIEPGDHERAFKASVPIRVGAYFVLFSALAFFSQFHIFIIAVTPIFLATLGETVILAGMYRWAKRSPRVAYGYLLIEILAQTLIFWFMGPFRIVAALVVYIFELMNTGIRLSRLGYFVTANVFILFYGALVFLENTGVIRTFPDNHIQFDLVQRYTTVLVGLFSMNMAAWFVSSFDHFLEQKAVALAAAKRKVQEHSALLERKVEERTRELVEANRALEMTNQEITDLQKRAEEFISAVGHDLKSPLSAICNIVPLYEGASEEGNSDEAREYLTRIRWNARKAYDMAVALQEAFRRAMSPEPVARVDLGEVLRALEPEIRVGLKRQGIELRVASDLPTVHAQPEKITHVLRNLITNAIKYAGGVENPWIEIGGSTRDAEVIFFVRDNGPGIPREYHERIFKMFHRVSDTVGQDPEGKGVGLAVVKMIVHKHRGRIWVESEPGAGTTFWVVLPRADSEKDI